MSESYAAEVSARRIEERALNAWPALQQVLYDGWIIRYADGYTRRANSVMPFLGGRLSPQCKVARCEETYSAWDLPTVFKMPPWSGADGLDRLLEDRGYVRQALTSVQTCRLEGAKPATASDLRFSAEAEGAWLAAYQEITGADPAEMVKMRRILKGIVPESCYALCYEGGRAVACGRSVCEDGVVGLYGIATDPARRRRGHAARLIEGLLERAARHGAQSGYLQVAADNAPALNLYARLGFSETYRYWYRVKAA